MTANFDKLHPTLVDAHKRIVDIFTTLGFDAVAVEAVRTFDQQAALYAEGRTMPGPIVTNAPAGQGPHEVKADGWGHAIDYGFWDHAHPERGLWHVAHPWPLLGALARQLGLKWGGDFHSFKGDLGHVEL